MKTIYNAVLLQLKTTVPELKWIDYDRGQLDKQNERPALAFPCGLIGIKLPQCKDITDKTQDCKAIVTLRLAFDTLNTKTSSLESDEKRAVALEPLDTISDVYATLQGYECESFNALSRRSQGDEKRTDGLFVYRIEFGCDFEDDTAE